MRNFKISLLIGAALVAMTSCGGSDGSSGSGLFGGIPETMAKYKQESKAITEGMTESNYEKEMAKDNDLKEKTKAELEKEGEALNGKELAVSVDENELKIETPLTMVYKSVFSNLQAVEFGFEGKIVAAKDLKLEINASDLKGRELLGGAATVVTAKQPVQLELLDKDGNAVDTREIGYLMAENNGEEAIVKAGTPMDFLGSFPVSDKYVDVVSAKLVLDFTKGRTQEGMPEQ